MHVPLTGLLSAAVRSTYAAMVSVTVHTRASGADSQGLYTACHVCAL
jgi:hypothetical protein